jgi:hypothetical protein
MQCRAPARSYDAAAPTGKSPQAIVYTPDSHADSTMTGARHFIREGVFRRVCAVREVEYKASIG